jgi:uncharacterized membrane protein YhaH (DUF805 family)
MCCGAAVMQKLATGGWMMSSLFQLEGRSTRRGFWAVVVLYLVFSNVVNQTLVDGDTTPAVMTSVMAPAVTLLVFAMVRRLHDLGRSGLWLLVYFGAPVMALAALFAHEFQGEWTPLDVTLVLLTVLSLLLGGSGFGDMMSQRGTQGANRFGPDPRGVSG